jgi:hypothetical protein
MLRRPPRTTSRRCWAEPAGLPQPGVSCGAGWSQSCRSVEDLVQTLGVDDAVVVAPPRTSALHQPCVDEPAEVLGDQALGEPSLVNTLCHAPLAAQQQPEQAKAVGFGNGRQHSKNALVWSANCRPAVRAGRADGEHPFREAAAVSCVEPVREPEVCLLPGATRRSQSAIVRRAHRRSHTAAPIMSADSTISRIRSPELSTDATASPARDAGGREPDSAARGSL